MSKRIYVGNLPWSVTKDKLDELFSSFGDMEESLVIVNKYTGKSRGFGFVTFKNDADADKAIAKMDGESVEDRDLSVREAKPMKEGFDEKSESKDKKTPIEEKTSEDVSEKPKEK